MSTLLGGLTSAEFLTTYWQKKPLLIRQAIPSFAGFVDVKDLCAWAKKEHVAARVVSASKGKRHLQTAPLSMTPAQLGPQSSILVQGVEQLHEQGWPLLMQFDGVIPRARLDDLMVSYATDGGGVGPHTDRYDVFLLQGAGKRRWRLQYAPDPAVDERQEVPTLKRFVPDVEYVLEPGDMLYLPPGVAHDGIAVDGPCFTYSIGAVAPSHEALLQNFLAFLSQRVDATVDMAAMYEDPDLQPPTAPAALSSAMTARVSSLLSPLRLTDAAFADAVDEFTGRLLTGPKSSAVFVPPKSVLRGEALRARLLQEGSEVRLSRCSRGLVSSSRVFLNGEGVVISDDVGAGVGAAWQGLFAARRQGTPWPAAMLGDVDSALFSFVEAAFTSGQLELHRAPRGAEPKA